MITSGYYTENIINVKHDYTTEVHSIEFQASLHGSTYDFYSHVHEAKIDGSCIQPYIHFIAT